MAEESIIHIIVIVLATWRISSFFSKNESGPFDMFHKIRRASGVRYDTESNLYGTNSFSKGLICLWCNSMWFAIIFVLLYLVLGVILVYALLPFAISTMVIMIDKIGE